MPILIAAVVIGVALVTAKVESIVSRHNEVKSQFVSKGAFTFAAEAIPCDKDNCGKTPQ